MFSSARIIIEACDLEPITTAIAFGCGSSVTATLAEAAPDSRVSSSPSGRFSHLMLLAL